MPRSAIREFMGLAATRPGTIRLELGEPDFVTPEHIRLAAARELESGSTAYTAYTSNSGLLELRLALAAHLKEAGGLDLRECFVDGTFVPAKKGGAWLEKPSGARAPRSWVSQTVTVFLSPCGQKVLRQLK